MGGLMIVILISAFIVGEETSNNFTCVLEPHKVQQGEDLWGIAEKNCEGDIQRVTDNLSDVYGTTIQPGWNIYLPENENCLLELRDGEVYESCEK